MYVAITRARERLYMSFSQTRLLHGQTRYNLKSRFLDELPEQDLKWLTARNRRGGYDAYGDSQDGGYEGRGGYGSQGGFGRFGGNRGGAYPVASGGDAGDQLRRLFRLARERGHPDPQRPA